MSSKQASNNLGLCPVRDSNCAFVARLVPVYQMLQNCCVSKREILFTKYRDNKCEQLVRTERLKCCRG
jgi:hypothetical protein